MRAQLDQMAKSVRKPPGTSTSHARRRHHKAAQQTDAQTVQTDRISAHARLTAPPMGGQLFSGNKPCPPNSNQKGTEQLREDPALRSTARDQLQDARFGTERHRKQSRQPITAKSIWSMTTMDRRSITRHLEERGGASNKGART